MAPLNNGKSSATATPKKKSSKNTISSDITELITQKHDELRQCYDLNRSKPALGLQKALDVMHVAEEIGSPGLRASAMVYASDACRFLGREDESRRYIHEAEKLLKGISDIRERRFLAGILGKHYIACDEVEIGLNYLREAEEHGVALGFSEENMAGTYQSIGIALFKAGAYEEALDYNLRVLELARKEQRLWGILQITINIGTVHAKLLDSTKALECYEQALEVSRELNNAECEATCLQNLGCLLTETGRPADGLPHLELGIEKARALGNRHYMAENLGSLADCHAALGNVARAIQYYDEALAMAHETGEKVLYAYLLGMKGNLLQREGNLGTVLEIFKESLAISEQCKLPDQNMQSHAHLADIYMRMGEFEKSCYHQQKKFEIYQSIVGVERQRAVMAVKLKYAQRDARQEREILQLRAEKAERESETKTRELNTIVLQLTQRNEAFKTLRKLVEPYVLDGRGQTKLLATTVQKSIAAAVDSHAEWRMFEQQFESVHRDFIRTLRERCPALTPTEIRICVLIRLNLSSKQIADTLFTSALTIKTHRANIRRKLLPGNEQNLTGFLMSI